MFSRLPRLLGGHERAGKRTGVARERSARLDPSYAALRAVQLKEEARLKLSEQSAARGSRPAQGADLQRAQSPAQGGPFQSPQSASPQSASPQSTGPQPRKSQTRSLQRGEVPGAGEPDRLFAVQTRLGVRLVALSAAQVTMLKTLRLASQGAELADDGQGLFTKMSVREYEVSDWHSRPVKVRPRRELTLEPWAIGRVDPFPLLRLPRPAT